MDRIFLVGFMGAGKTSAGQALAQLLGSCFVDLDERLSRRFGAPIEVVFARHGEAEFRAAETEELAAVAALDGAVVVATGGGTFCREANRRLIEEAGGVSVYFDLPWPALLRRLESDHEGRPMYGDRGRAERLWEERQPDYRRAALTVALCGDERAEEVAAMVAGALRGASCAT
jgi:shikimate kinase